MSGRRDRERRTPHTGVRAVARGHGNVWAVEVVGRTGTFRGTRRTLSDALATARRYARLFDAPRRAI